MTVPDNTIDLATSWQNCNGIACNKCSNNVLDVNEFYYDALKSVFDEVIKKSQLEGITDLNCVVFKVPIELDFSNLINYNRNPKYLCSYSIFTFFQPSFTITLIRRVQKS